MDLVAPLPPADTSHLFCPPEEEAKVLSAVLILVSSLRITICISLHDTARYIIHTTTREYGYEHDRASTRPTIQARYAIQVRYNVECGDDGEGKVGESPLLKLYEPTQMGASDCGLNLVLVCTRGVRHGVLMAVRHLWLGSLVFFLGTD